MKRLGHFSCLVLVTVFFFFYFRQTIKNLWTLTPEKIESWSEYRSVDPASFTVFESQIKGTGLSKNNVNQILVDCTVRGLILFPLTNAAAGLVTLNVATDGDPGLACVLSLVNTANGSEQYIRKNLVFRQDSFDLTAAVQKHLYDTIAFYGRGSSGRYVVLGEFVLRHMPSIQRMPPFPVLLMGLGCLIFLHRFIRHQKKKKLELLLMYAAVVICLILGFFNSQSILDQPLFWLVLFFGLLIAGQQGMGGGPRLAHGWLWGILAIAFLVRWELLQARIGQDLLGDSTEYFAYAVRQSGFSFTYDHREPFYIWIQTIAGKIWGFYPFQFRLLTLIFSVANVALSYFLFLRLSRREDAASIGAAFMAAGQFISSNSVRGERNELFLFLMLIFFLILVSQKRNILSHAVLGLVGGFASLTWLIGIIAAGLAYAAFAVRDRVPAKASAAFLVAFGIVVCPHLIIQKKIHGDPFYSLNVHAKYYGEGDKGANGLADVALKTGPKLMQDTAKGYFDIFLNPFHYINTILLGFTSRASWIFFPFLAAGIILCVRRKEWEIFILIFSLLNISPAFFSRILDIRLLLHAAPLVAYFTGQGLVFAGDFVRRSRLVKAKKSPR